MPGKLNIAAALQSARTVVFTPFVNETSVAAEWTLPTTSFLEEWGDARVDGTHDREVYGIVQPAVSPRPGSIPLGDLLLQIWAKAGIAVPGASVRDILQKRMSQQDWLKALERGGIWKDAPLKWSPYHAAPLFPPPPPANKQSASAPTGQSAWQALSAEKPAQAAPRFEGSGDFTLVPYPSPVYHDGSITNRPWIPEMPDPVTQCNWTSWVEINPETAKKLGIERGDLLRVTSDSGSIEAPALPSPTVHPDAVAIPVGLGHTSFGRYAFGKGINPLTLVTPAWQDGSDELVWASTRVKLAKTGTKGRLIAYDQRYTPTKHRELEE
jgi:anaerobic selenocysteine-containing dehydrogenase